MSKSLTPRDITVTLTPEENLGLKTFVTKALMIDGARVFKEMLAEDPDNAQEFHNAVRKFTEEEEAAFFEQEINDYTGE